MAQWLAWPSGLFAPPCLDALLNVLLWATVGGGGSQTTGVLGLVASQVCRQLAFCLSSAFVDLPVEVSACPCPVVGAWLQEANAAIVMKALKAVRDVDPTVEALDFVALDTLMKYLYVLPCRDLN